MESLMVTDCGVVYGPPGGVKVGVAAAGGPVMVNNTEVVLDRLPLTPVMKTVELPAAAPADAEMVIIEVPEPVMEEGMKVTETPLG